VSFDGFICDNCGLLQEGPGVIVGVDFTNRVIFDGGVVIDASLPECGTFVGGRILLKDVRGDEVFFNELSAGSRVIDAVFALVRIDVDTVHILRTLMSDGVSVGRGGGVEIVNSVVTGRDEALIVCEDCARILVVATNIIADNSAAAIRTLNAPAAEVVVLGVNARVRTTGTFIDADAAGSGQTVAMAGCLIDAFGGDVLRQGGASTIAATGTSFATCGGAVCITGDLGDLTFDQTGFRTIEAAEVATFAYAGAFVDQFSPSFIADIDGECLFGREAIRSGPDQ
jgi:hypothetical protein